MPTLGPPAGRAALTEPHHDPPAIAVALFAAFVVGGILAVIMPLWAVVLIGLAVGAGAFVFMDRYPRVRDRGPDPFPLPPATLTASVGWAPGGVASLTARRPGRARHGPGLAGSSRDHLRERTLW